MTNLATSYKPAAGISDSITLAEPYTLTAVAFINGSSFVGYESGLAQGSISPTTLNGNTIASLYTNITASATIFEVIGLVPQDFFTSITANSITRDSATADSYSQFGGRTSWAWLTTVMFPSANSYQVVII